MFLRDRLNFFNALAAFPRPNPAFLTPEHKKAGGPHEATGFDCG